MRWYKELWNFQKRCFMKIGILVKRVKRENYAGRFMGGSGSAKRGTVVFNPQCSDRGREIGDIRPLNGIIENF
jgi:hypothetical protein